MEKETQTCLMHHERFGEGERFAHKASQPLPKGIIPAFDVSRFASCLADGCMLLLRNDSLIGDPKVSGAVTRTVD
jgi:hypothetical protein